MPPSAACGLIPNLCPRLVADLTTKLDGVIGLRSACGTKNSAAVVKICKSRPDRKAVIAFTLSVSRVAMRASSSKPSAILKLKKSPILEPKIVEGLFALPPKNNLDSWKVHVLGQPLVFDHASSYPVSSSQEPEAIATSFS